MASKKNRIAASVARKQAKKEAQLHPKKGNTFKLGWGPQSKRSQAIGHVPVELALPILLRRLKGSPDLPVAETPK